MRITKWEKQSIVRAIINDIPRIDKTERKKDLQDEVVKIMSAECRKVFNKTPTALANTHIGNVIYDEKDWDSRNIIVGDVSKEQIDNISSLKKYIEEDDLHRDTCTNVRIAVEACSTLKQLQERLPQFEKYFPTKDAPASNLPATTNLITDLTKLGWPKDTKKSKPKV